jgi:hypothetical protein
MGFAEFPAEGIYLGLILGLFRDPSFDPYPFYFWANPKTLAQGK